MSSEILLLAFGRVSQVLIMFLSYRVMTKVLSVQEVGFYLLLMSIISYFGLVVVGPVGNFISRKIHGWEERKESLNMFFLFNLFLVGVSILVFPTIYIASNFNEFQGYSWTVVALAVSLFLFSTSWNNTLIPMLNLLGYRKSFVLFTFLTQLCCLIFSFLAVNSIMETALYWFIGQAFSFLIWFLVAMLFFKTQTKEKLDVSQAFSTLSRERLKGLVTFSLPFVFTNISMWVLNQSYRPVVERLYGLEILGLIGIGLGLSSSLSTSFEYLMQQFYLPNFYKSINSLDQNIREKSWNILFTKLVPLYLSVAVFLSIASKFLINLLADTKFESAWVYLSIGAIIEFLRMTNNVFCLAAQSEYNTKKTIVPYFIGAVATFLLFYLVYYMGVSTVFVPMSIVFGNVLVMAVLYFSINRDFSLNFDLKPLVKSLLLSFPMFLVLIPSFEINLLSSVVVLASLGTYLLFVLYTLFSRGEKLYGK